MENSNNQKENIVGLQTIKEYFQSIIDVRHGVNKVEVIEEINAKKSMAGANAWMLICSIIIASIGLDQNSDAVIIGAMLISPLMSPILGIGLGIGVNDKEILKKSFLSFAISILIAIVASTLYFYLTPFGKMTPAIAARTEPNTLDVLVAIFGGLAGIISIVRKDLSTTLPGVAIATALMPPLCVTGYGLSCGHWNIALNSFYLFFLNTCFISLSTYVIIRFLRFPYRKYIRKKDRLRNKLIIVFFAILAIFPSMFILNKVLHKNRIQMLAKQYFEQDLGDRAIFVDEYVIAEGDTSNVIFIKVYGQNIKPEESKQMEEDLRKKGIEDYSVQIINSSDVDLTKITNLQNQISSVQLEAQQQLEERNQQITMLINKMQLDSLYQSQTLAETAILFPEIEIKSFGRVQSYILDEHSKIPILVIETKKSTKQETIDKMVSFLKIKVNADSIAVFRK